MRQFFKRQKINTMGHSCLLSELLEQIGSGRSSFYSAQRLAAAAIHEGVGSPAIQNFASLGAQGKHAKNIERDGHRWLQNLHNFGLKVYSIKLKVKDNGTAAVIDLPVLSIHHLIGCIWHAGELQRTISLLGPAGAAEPGRFWGEAEQASWFSSHVARSQIGDLSRTLGLVLHCDGVEVYTGQELY